MPDTPLLGILLQVISPWTLRYLHKPYPLNEVPTGLVLLPTTHLDCCQSARVLYYRINDIQGYTIFRTTSASIEELPYN